MNILLIVLAYFPFHSLAHSAMTCVDFQGTCRIRPRGNNVSPRWNGNGPPTCQDTSGTAAGIITTGQTFTLQWPARNHAVNNQNPRVVKGFIAPGFGTPSIAAFGTPVCEGPYINCGQGANVDTAGDNTPCTLDCKLPLDQAPGDYTFLWDWDWTQNDGSHYTTCADIKVVTGGPTTPPTPGPPTRPQTNAPTINRANCAEDYDQCGGIGFTGPKCCKNGGCVKSNDYYSQCLPDAAPDTPPPIPPPTTPPVSGPTTVPPSTDMGGVFGGLVVPKNPIWSDNFVNYVEKSSFCACGFGSACNGIGSGNGVIICAGGGTAGGGGGCDTNACATGQYSFTAAEGWKIQVSQFGSPYRAFSYIGFCGENNANSCLIGTTTFTFSFKLDNVDKWGGYVKILFFGDGNDVLGVWPDRMKLVAFPAGDLPTAWAFDLDLKSDVWYDVTIKITKASNSLDIKVYDNAEKKTYDGWTGTIGSLESKAQLGVYTWSNTGDPFALNLRNLCVGTTDSCVFSYTTPTIPTPTGADVSCPAQGDWPKTKAGEIASLPCPSGDTHTDKQRKCNEDGQWGISNNNCQIPPSCTDGIMNGLETGIDCGGDSCAACGVCQSINCGSYGSCSVKDGVETCACITGYSGKNCEIPPPCGLSCQNNGFCQIRNGESECACMPNYFGKICEIPIDATCFDGLQNQDEEGIDCGGTSCKSCSGNYRWVTGEFSPCSKNCGGGTQTRSVECVNSATGVVVVPKTDWIIKCNPSVLHPTLDSQPCNVQECPIYTWSVGEWEACTRSCGSGKRIRSVKCLSSVGKPDDVVSDFLCNVGLKPVSESNCNEQSCTTVNWKTGEWSNCTVECGGGSQARNCIVECGGGSQTRSVDCVDINGNLDSTSCDNLQGKPDDTRSCNMEPCATYTWSACNWEECTATCGGGDGMIGRQTRQIFCNGLNGIVDFSKCDSKTRPPDTFNGCGNTPCVDVNWMADSGWSACRDGIKRRTFHCHGNTGVNLPSSACANIPKPSTIKDCQLNTCDENVIIIANSGSLIHFSPVQSLALTIVLSALFLCK